MSETMIPRVKIARPDGLAERAFVALAPLADWATVAPADVQHLREKVTQIITDCGDVRYRTDCE